MAEYRYVCGQEEPDQFSPIAILLYTDGDWLLARTVIGVVIHVARHKCTKCHQKFRNLVDDKIYFVCED